MTRDLEFEYSLSQNNKRFNEPSQVIQSHIDFISEESKNALDEVKSELNIEYGEGEFQKFDYFYDDKTKSDAPIFVYIHGGYWQEYGLHKNNSRYCVRPLVKNGLRVIVVEYDTCPNTTVQKQTEQIQKAGEAILKYANKVTARYVIFSGHSSGAHLCSYLFSKQFLGSTPHANLIKHFFLISGVYDLTELYKLSSVNKDNLLSLTDESAKHLSPLHQDWTHLKNEPFEIRIYVAEHDTETFINQSQKLAEKIKEDAGNDVVFKIIYDYDHFNIVEDLSLDWFYITKDIFATMNL